jgi:hypothetical protein
MAGEPAAALEQLLPRFEALRNSGAIKVLAEDTAAEAMLSDELPPRYREFSGSGFRLGIRYGKPRRQRHPAMSFRLLGEPADIRRFMAAAQAAGKLLKGRLTQAHLVKAKEVQGANGKAEQAIWLISLFAAARKQLPTDGLAGGDWYLWHRASGIVAAEGTVERYRGPRPAAAAPLAAVVELAQSDEEPAAFAMLGDAAETSIALLHWLAERWEASPNDGESRAPKMTTCQLLEELCSTAEGLERAEAAWGQGGQQALARLVGKRSAGSVNRSPYFKSELLPQLEKLQAARAMQRDRVSRFREDADGSIQ